MVCFLLEPVRKTREPGDNPGPRTVHGAVQGAQTTGAAGGAQV